jgi:hypothetical protein
MNVNQPSDATPGNAIDLRLTWVAALPVLIAALRDGDRTGRSRAQQELMRMAEAADLCFGAVHALTGLVDGEHVSSTERVAITSLLNRVQDVTRPGESTSISTT